MGWDGLGLHSNGNWNPISQERHCELSAPSRERYHDQAVCLCIIKSLNGLRVRINALSQTDDEQVESHTHCRSIDRRIDK
jgi:hypothetical protein